MVRHCIAIDAGVCLRPAVAAALVLAAMATGITCGDDNGTGSHNQQLSVYGQYTWDSGEPLADVVVRATVRVCVAHCSSWSESEWEERVKASTRTDADGHYALEFWDGCTGGHPDATVRCVVPLPQGGSELCDAMLRCTAEPQERNCIITPH